MPHTRPASAIADPSTAFGAVRARSLSLAEGLSDADATVQSMEDASPAKWHLAHTTWFFETFLLTGDPAYTPFDPAYAFLFNSYYEGVGERHPRPLRGMLSRPCLDEVLAYRAHVDERMADRIAAGNADPRLLAVGIAHEEQHQELLLTDILHAFSKNPLRPAFRKPSPIAVDDAPLADGWTAHEGGTVEIGHDPTSDSFAFDCEKPRHEVRLYPFLLADRAVTCGEWKAFMADGGYEQPLLWLSDGWAHAAQEDWTAPLYWENTDEGWTTMTLRGRQPVDDRVPVTHISYYEAVAYANWAGARLPTEAEWEVAAGRWTHPGNDLSSERYRPAPQLAEGADGPKGMLGDVWEWTASAYAPYPGFRTEGGIAGEYNGKFMSGQMVLRGGSCATPPQGARNAARNFFHPGKRWQFSGVRLAKDA